MIEVIEGKNENWFIKQKSKATFKSYR
jgi:hypothetical protein